MHIHDAVTTFITPSAYMAGRLQEWGFSRERVALNPNFTDVPARPPAQGEGGIYAGRLSAEKGLDVLLEALRSAGDPPFTIVGGGPLEADLRALATKLGLTSCRFAGVVPHDEVVRLLHSARYFVMPSLWHENAPLALLEAMASGRACIVSRRGGLPELIEGRGLVVEPVADQLAEAITRVRAGGSEIEEMGAAAHRFASDELSPEIHLARLEAIYTAAAGTSRP
jgi:glycosyltransferase involved in cell wall biosynthesis